MSRNILRIFSVFTLAALMLSACAPAATPTQAPAKTEAPAKPTEAPAKPTDAPAKPTAIPAKPTDVPAKPTEALVVTEEAVKAGMLPVVDPGTVTGDVISAGSSTVFPLAEAVADQFKSEGYTGNLTIDSIGTGGGFERFCKTGETDVSNASRKIKTPNSKAAQLSVALPSNSASEPTPLLWLSAAKMTSSPMSASKNSH